MKLGTPTQTSLYLQQPSRDHFSVFVHPLRPESRGRRTTLIVAFLLMALFLLGFAARIAAAAQLVAIDASNNLVRFTSTAPGTITGTTAITNLETGDQIKALDLRPANGLLYGLGINGTAAHLYVINPVSGVATLVGDGTAVSGTDFGFDFNPTVDRVRVVSDADLNLRLNPITGLLAATDPTLAYAGTDTNNGQNPNVVGSAYTNNFAGATSTTLFGIDSNLDILVTQNPPNNGTLNTVGALGVNATGVLGFDISGDDGTAFAALQVGGNSGLYTVNLTTGAATLVGTIGSGAEIRGLTVLPATAPAPDLVVTNTSDNVIGSLRNAILLADGIDGADTITFNIPGSGPHIIIANSALPAITDPATIDGRSEPDFNSNTHIPAVVLDGTAAGPGADGLSIEGAAAVGSTIKALQIVNFNGEGIEINDSPDVVIAGNYIGTNGASDLGNSVSGVVASGNCPGLRIGGTTVADRNVISGNGSNMILGSTGEIVVQGNFIGTDASGTTAINASPAGTGIYFSGVGGVTIGGTTAGAGNLISGNSTGVLIESIGTEDAIVQGNLIGTDASGSAAIGNDTGIYLSFFDGTQIGGNTPGARNVISGNGTGILFTNGASDSLVQGNYIGTDITGSAAVANSIGISVDLNATNNLIGGTVAGAGNLISGNSIGINVRFASQNFVQGNLIGTDAAGTGALGNSIDGVRIQADPSFSNETLRNVIGGSTPAAGNIIAFNGSAGVLVSNEGTPPAGRAILNAIRLNSIHDNGGLGIDLSVTSSFNPDGVTFNDPGDADLGPNNRQNFPVLTSASTGPGGITVQGNLDSLPNTTFLVDFYGNAAPDPTGNGEGQIYMGTKSVTTDGSGHVSFTTTLPTVAAAQVTATATTTADAPAGDTSEFSPGIVISGAAGSFRFSQTGYTVNENGGSAIITVQRVGGSFGIASVHYDASTGTATPGVDYSAASGTLNFASGETTRTFAIPVANDNIDEPDETIKLTLSNPSAGAALGSPSAAVLTINDNDAAPSLSVSNASVTEANNGSTSNMTFTVSLSAASGQTVTVNFATANATATAPADYVTLNGGLTFPAGVTSKTVTIVIKGDNTDEPNETFTLNLSSPTNAGIADAQGVGTIVDNDGTPTLSINNVSVNEVNSGSNSTATFTVSLSAGSLSTVTVNYATANGTATQPADYVSKSGTLTFAPGELSKPITVTVKGDNLDEANETFVVNLTSPTHAALADAQGAASIIDNDAAPSLSINDVTVTEANSGSTSNATFTVSLSAASGQTVTVFFATANDTAIAPDDYVALNGGLTFPAGVISKTVTVVVKGDNLHEANEKFALNLNTPTNATIADGHGVCTITDNDSAALVSNLSSVRLSAASARAAAGTISLNFTSSLDTDSATDVSHYSVLLNGSAVEVVSAGCNATGSTVTLGLADGSLHSGDQVIVEWNNLLDNYGATLSGKSGVVAAR